jgi:Sigma-70 factor, region 1.2
MSLQASKAADSPLLDRSNASMFSEMGINVVETEEAEGEVAAAEEAREEPEEPEEEESDGELVEVSRSTPAETKKSEPGERTDDPVRMYLREMGSVELLWREGEIAIAKRIEAGREAMIAGLCESPLTFQAIIIWRDELNDGGAIRGGGRLIFTRFGLQLDFWVSAQPSTGGSRAHLGGALHQR